MIIDETSPREASADAADETSETLAAINKELAVLSYSLSHDLRAPLRAVEAFSEALAEDYADRLDETGLDYLRRIRSAAQHMDTLIRNLVDLAGVSRSELRRQPVDVTEVAYGIAEKLKARDSSRQVEFSIDPDLKANADPALLRTALLHLIENAWKFTRKRSSARIDIGSLQRDRRRVFYVRDDGAGFDPAAATRMFGPFQRFHTEAEFEGTGIGLAMVQRIAHRHGGKVWAEGKVDEGATFYLSLG